MELRPYPIQSDLSAGFDFDHYNPANLPVLPPEEAVKPYAGLYYRGVCPPPPHLAALFEKGAVINPDEAILPGQGDCLFQPEDGGAAQGYCLLPNGVGYGSAVVELPNVPPELFDWYKGEKRNNDLAYRIWYPGSHISEKNHLTIEDVGLGTEALYPAHKMDWKIFGLSVNPAEADPRFARLMGGSSTPKPLDQRGEQVQPRALSIAHYVTRLPGGGSRFRTMFYVGAHIVEGRLVPVSVPEPEICLEVTRRMLSHCITERYNLTAFLPTLYTMINGTPFEG